MFFESLYRSHFAAVSGYAARRTDEHSARDVVAETFLTAWRRIGVIPRAGVLPWLYAVARNVLREQHRSQSRRARLDDRLRGQAQSHVADPADGVVDDIHAQRLLAMLAPKDREALELVEWECLDIASAARVVGCTPATFRVRLHRARRRLGAAAERASSPIKATALEGVMP